LRLFWGVKNIERKIDNFNLKTPKNININIIPQDLENIDVNQSPMLRVLVLASLK
jgi:hypothetical protein